MGDNAPDTKPQPTAGSPAASSVSSAPPPSGGTAAPAGKPRPAGAAADGALPASPKGAAPAKGVDLAGLGDQITNLGKQIAATAISRLGSAVELSEADVAIVESAATGLATATVMAIGAADDQIEDIRWEASANAQALSNMETAQAVAVGIALKAAAAEIIPQVFQAALAIGLSAVGGPAGGAIGAAIGGFLRNQF